MVNKKILKHEALLSLTDLKAEKINRDKMFEIIGKDSDMFFSALTEEYSEGDKNGKDKISYINFTDQKYALTERIHPECDDEDYWKYLGSDKEIKSLKRKLGIAKKCVPVFTFSKSQKTCNTTSYVSVFPESEKSPRYFIRENENWWFFIPSRIKCQVEIDTSSMKNDGKIYNLDVKNETIYSPEYDRNSYIFAVSKEEDPEENGLFIISSSLCTTPLSAYNHDGDKFLQSFPTDFWCDDVSLKLLKEYKDSEVDVEELFYNQERSFIDASHTKSSWMIEWDDFDLDETVNALTLCNAPYETRNKNEKTERHCRYCGSVINSEITVCPCCHKENSRETFPYLTLNNNNKYFIYKTMSDGALAYIEFMLDFDEKTYIKSCEERILMPKVVSLFFFNTSNKERYNGEGKPMVGSFRTNNSICLMTNNELAAEISKSVFSRCGLADAWGLNPDFPERKLEDTGYLDSDPKNKSYIFNVFNSPGVEQLLKGFGDRALSFIKNQPNRVDFTQTSLPKILGCTPALCKYLLKSKNISLNAIGGFDDLMQYDEKTTFDDCGFFMFDNDDSYVDVIGILHLAKEEKITQINISTLKKYFIKCRDVQKLSLRTAVVTYRDYLYNAINIEYDLTNNRTLFPSELMKDHDESVKAFNLCKEQIKNKDFVKAYENFGYLLSEDEKFFVMMPKSPEELIAEGKSQSHCVGGYVDRVVNKSSLIVFIRTKAAPDKSLYTIEVTPDTKRIVQIRGFGNRLAKQADEIQFIERWIDEKKLVGNINKLCDVPSNYVSYKKF